MSSNTRGSDEFVSPYNQEVRASRCHFCPTTHNLQTHHIIPQRKNGSDRKENLVIVCERCHQKLESLYDQRFYERLGLSDNKGEERSHFACSWSDCRDTATSKVDLQHGGDGWYCTKHGGWMVSRGSTLDKVTGEVEFDGVMETADAYREFDRPSEVFDDE